MTQWLWAAVIHPLQTCMAYCRLQTHDGRQPGLHSSICKQQAMPGVQQAKALVFHRTMEIGANTVLSAYFSSHCWRKGWIQNVTDAFLALMWNILYWSCYSICIRRAKASWLTVFRLPNRSQTLTLRDYKRSEPIWVYFVNPYESIAAQCSQRLVYLYIREFRTSWTGVVNLNHVIPILAEEKQWLTLPFSWV